MIKTNSKIETEAPTLKSRKEWKIGITNIYERNLSYPLTSYSSLSRL